MSLTVDGVWKVGVWATTVWADGVWHEGAPTPTPTPPPVPAIASVPYFDAEYIGKRRKRKATDLLLLLLG